MVRKPFQPVLDKLNAASEDICALVLMTKDGVALASVPSHGQPICHEDKISSLSASILHLGNRLMADVVGGGVEQLVIKGNESHLLAVPGHEFALTALVKPQAELGPILSLMEQAMEDMLNLP